MRNEHVTFTGRCFYYYKLNLEGIEEPLRNYYVCYVITILYLFYPFTMWKNTLKHSSHYELTIK